MALDGSLETRQIALLESFAYSHYSGGKTGTYFDKARVKRLFGESDEELLRALEELASQPVESQAVQIGLLQVLIEFDEIATPARLKLVEILKRNRLGDIAQYNLADV